MKLTYEKLMAKMPEITGLLFTHPVMQYDSATEIWIKFRNDGVYVFINFEQPLPTKIELLKLVGKGNALNCSDYKRDNELIQHNEKSAVIDILEKSTNYRGNISETVLMVKALFDSFENKYLYR